MSEVIMQKHGNLNGDTSYQFNTISHRHLPDHPNADSKGCIKEYRLRASIALGRALPNDCEIHHFNSELVICENRKYHKFLHQRQRAFELSGDSNKRRCLYCSQYDDVSNLSHSGKKYRHPSCHSKYETNRLKEKREELRKCRMSEPLREIEEALRRITNSGSINDGEEGGG